jgi:hypothetical protein
MNKYHAKKTTIDNITFDSIRESQRYNELKMLLRANKIAHLELQVPFQVTINGKKICKYLADFQYVDLETGKVVIEDTKGFRTQVYRLKKRLVEAQYGITITEVA